VHNTHILLAVIAEFTVHFITEQKKIIFFNQVAEGFKFCFSIKIPGWIPGLQIIIPRVLGVMAFSNSAMGGRAKPESI